MQAVLGRLYQAVLCRLYYAGCSADCNTAVPTGHSSGLYRLDSVRALEVVLDDLDERERDHARVELCRGQVRFVQFRRVADRYLRAVRDVCHRRPAAVEWYSIPAAVLREYSTVRTAAVTLS